MKPVTTATTYDHSQRTFTVERRNVATGAGCVIVHRNCSPQRQAELLDRLRRQLIGK